KSYWTPSLMKRAVSMLVAFNHLLVPVAEYRVTKLWTSFALNRLKISSRGRSRVPPIVTVLVRRISTCVCRGSNCELGSYKWTVTVAGHAPVPAGQEARLRPSDGAICALVKTTVAGFAVPGRLTRVALTSSPHQGSGYAPDNLRFVWPCHGSTLRQGPKAPSANALKS